MSPAEAVVKAELEERRDRLTAALADTRRPDLAELLERLDDALNRLGTADWGICVSCKGHIEDDRLVADPLVRVCLECLDEAQRRDLERDLETAARVQSKLLPPRQLVQSGWEIAYLWEPLGAVSGDHIDLVPAAAPGDPVQLMLGDVAGKGIAASLLQSQLHALFRAAQQPELGLDEFIGRINRLFCNATAPNGYATLLATRLYDDGAVRWVNAGHLPPFLIRPNGVQELAGHSLPLGLFCDSYFEQREVALEPGETLVLYTDGWTEAPCGDEEYGRQRAARLLSGHAQSSLSELLQASREDLQSFIGNGRRVDDLSIVAVRRST